MNKQKVAVVGLGVGRQHIKHWLNLGDYFEIAMVCDPDKERREEVRKQLGCAATAEFSDVLAAGVDVIDICTPPHLHFDMAAKALTSGHHVVCEKPLVNSLAQVDELLAIKTDRFFMPISQYRFASGIQRLNFLNNEGMLGDCYVATVETHWNRGAQYYAEPWRGKWDTEMGGVVLCHALHLHDLLCFVLGDVGTVYAMTDTRVNPIETEDCAAISLRMRNGALVTSNATLGSREQISRLRFCFENLTAESNLSPYNPGRDPWTLSANGIQQEYRIAEALHAFSPPPAGFTGQFLGLHKAITGEAALPVTLADARRALELVTAIYASAESGSSVDLPLAGSHQNYSDWRPGR